jgi:hypothetical protein
MIGQELLQCNALIQGDPVTLDDPYGIVFASLTA